MGDDAVATELEALRATYTVHELQEEPGISGRPTLRFLAAPRDTHQRFVTCQLRMKLPAAYPEQQVELSLEDPRGLGEERQRRVTAALQQLAASLAGELAVGTLCEEALDLVTQENHPEGA
jgi:hypothetical protein